jgi:hypothetical protein
MTSRKSVISALLVLSFLTALPLVVAADPPPTPVAPSQCGPDFTSAPVANVVMTVKNDEDAGPSWYWGLDNYQKSVIIWQSTITDTKFCALVQYSGGWQTFKGAMSPGTGMILAHDGNGKMVAAYVASISATSQFNLNGMPTKGSLGTFNFGGTKSDILASPPNQQGDTNKVNYLNLYFGPGNWDFSYLAASYVYTQGNGLGYGNLWVSSPITSDANMGDIITH